MDNLQVLQEIAKSLDEYARTFPQTVGEAFIQVKSLQITQLRQALQAPTVKMVKTSAPATGEDAPFPETDPEAPNGNDA